MITKKVFVITVWASVLMGYFEHATAESGHAEGTLLTVGGDRWMTATYGFTPNLLRLGRSCDLHSPQCDTGTAIITRRGLTDGHFPISFVRFSDSYEPKMTCRVAGRPESSPARYSGYRGERCHNHDGRDGGNGANDQPG
jgi:hypothetical protein